MKGGRERGEYTLNVANLSLLFLSNIKKDRNEVCTWFYLNISKEISYITKAG